MSTETQLPASSAGVSKTPAFGTASLRLFPPQYVFDQVRWQACARPSADGTTPVASAANQNGKPPRNAAA